MEAFMTAVNILFIISCVSISYVFKMNYPKDINSLIGYRTKRSMASKEAWVFANGYFSKTLFRYAIMTVMIQIALFISLGPQAALIGILITWTLALLVTMVQTEFQLKKMQF